MKNIKGVFGILFLISFFVQLIQIITKPPITSAEVSSEIATRIGTTLAGSLILGILLVRSALKNKTEIKVETETKIDKNNKKIYLRYGVYSILVIVLMMISYMVGINNSNSYEKYLNDEIIKNRILLLDCLDNANSVNTISDCDLKYSN